MTGKAAPKRNEEVTKSNEQNLCTKAKKYPIFVLCISNSVRGAGIERKCTWPNQTTNVIRYDSVYQLSASFFRMHCLHVHYNVLGMVWEEGIVAIAKKKKKKIGANFGAVILFLRFHFPPLLRLNEKLFNPKKIPCG